MANSLEDSFNFVLDKGELWFGAFRRSDAVAERLFTDHSTPRERVRAATTLWFAAFFLSIVIGSPIYYRYGLRLDSLGFHLCSVLAQYCSLFAITWCFHRGLKTYGVRSSLFDTFVLQTTVAAGLAPLFTLATLPAKMRMLDILRHPGAVKPPLASALGQVLGHSVRRSGVLEIADMAALPVIIALLALGAARLVPILTKHYAADPWRVIRALAFASAILAPLPILGGAIVEVVLCHSFTPDNPTP
ncbi:MAG TPA: hypothetical protein VJ276_14330 [Thermoanaerobaculia bacterium]|nr:hypothetical protein [Thermoanaerobaculia bacterium]